MPMTTDTFDYWYPTAANGRRLKWAMKDIEIVSGKPFGFKADGVVRHHGVEYTAKSAPCGAGCHCAVQVTKMNPAARPKKPAESPNDPVVLAIAEANREEYGRFVAANPQVVVG